ncbi:MAG: hypothetical protein KGI00_03075 [Candidatus Micrarchaeota archaeon]|nr:hypothetical protein [Candidatus Micrarchaeota archaeon]MDE1849687.1 hypothetical protein [Candidatus Micrarchaeota archaeon]
MDRYGFLVPALFVGLFMAFITALIPSTPALLVGAAWYGMPISWIVRMVVAPQYNPWRIEYASFILDVLFWFVVAAIAMYIKLQTEKKQR